MTYHIRDLLWLPCVVSFHFALWTIIIWHQWGAGLYLVPMAVSLFATVGWSAIRHSPIPMSTIVLGAAASGLSSLHVVALFGWAGVVVFDLPWHWWGDLWPYAAGFVLANVGVGAFLAWVVYSGFLWMNSRIDSGKCHDMQ